MSSISTYWSVGWGLPVFTDKQLTEPWNAPWLKAVLVYIILHIRIFNNILNEDVSELCYGDCRIWFLHFSQITNFLVGGSCHWLSASITVSKDWRHILFFQFGSQSAKLFSTITCFFRWSSHMWSLDYVADLTASVMPLLYLSSREPPDEDTMGTYGTFSKNELWDIFI